jgi:ABC-2 type transport system permease protein
MVAEGQFAAVVIIPTGFDSVWSGKALPEIVTVLKSDTISGQTAQNSLQVVINRLDSAVKAADFSAELREQFQPFSGDADRHAYKMRILNQAVSAWEKPPLTIMDSQTGSDEDQGETSNAFSQSSPGMMVQFAIAGLIGAAEVIVLERRSGSLQRLLTTATTRAEILIGHFLAIFTMIFIQFVLLIGFAVIFLDVPYLNEPLATLLITLATVIFTASLGLLIGILAKSEEQAVIFSLIPMFILSGLGGAWMPLEFTHETFQTVGHLTPMAWAMDGYQNIIIRGQGLESVFIPSMVLVGFSSVCLLISIWRFRYQ